MLDALHDLIPASTNIIQSKWFITPDNIFNSLLAEGIPIVFNHLVFGDWDVEGTELEDLEILKMIHIEEADHSGELLIYTEACSRYYIDEFRCASTDLETFVEKFNLEMFFDGDVVVVCKESRTLTIFHHEGFYVHVKV